MSKFDSLDKAGVRQNNKKNVDVPIVAKGFTCSNVHKSVFHSDRNK